MSHSHAEVIHFVKPFIRKNGSPITKPHSPYSSPFSPTWLRNRPYLVSQSWQGEHFVQKEGHCQRVEISLSTGSGHNTPLFILKPTKVSICHLRIRSSRGSSCVWTVLIALDHITGWQFIRHNQLTMFFLCVWELFPLCLIDAVPSYVTAHYATIKD